MCLRDELLSQRIQRVYVCSHSYIDDGEGDELLRRLPLRTEDRGQVIHDVKIDLREVPIEVGVVFRGQQERKGVVRGHHKIGSLRPRKKKPHLRNHGF